MPVIDKGLATVGKTTKKVVETSIPIVEKGASTIYGTMATGFDLGVKGAKSVAKSVTKSKRSKRTRTSRKR